MTRDAEAWGRLGRALREARERQGLTQKELSDRANVSLAAVGDAEKGKVPKARMPYTLAKVAKALGWPAGSVEAVLEGSDPPGGWSQASVRIDAGLMEGVITRAMVTATDHATAAEIRAAVGIALDELRQHGVISERESS
ncbi:helix-turn-helix transcriptional regulator [Streptomyces carpaticus]|uniref:helix-turn-helix transcriptional regulator n=1 Tax=Streptomyces carpaticus TaxID=285558 RepID=UPI003D158865